MDNKKIISIAMVAIMVLSAFAVLGSMPVQQAATHNKAAATSAKLSLDPTVFSTLDDHVTVHVVSPNGTYQYDPGAPVNFYLSTSDSNSTEVLYLGTHDSTSVYGGMNAIVSFNFTGAHGFKPGTYYVLGDIGSNTYSYEQVTLTTQHPQFYINGMSNQTLYPGENATFTGVNYTAGDTVSIFFAYPGNNTPLTTVTVAKNGTFSKTVKVPNLSGTIYYEASEKEYLAPYNLIAQQDASSNGLTANATLEITPHVMVSPSSFNGLNGSTLTVNGYGFIAGETLGANTSKVFNVTLSRDNYMVNASNPAVTVASDGTFTMKITTLMNFTEYGAFDISINNISGLPTSVKYTYTNFTQSNVVFVSTPNTLMDLGFYFNVMKGTNKYYYQGEPFYGVVFNFMPNAAVSIDLGGIAIATGKTNSLGYANITGTLPAMPAGKYNVTAQQAYLVAGTSDNTTVGTSPILNNITISSYFVVYDKTGMLSNITSPTKAYETQYISTGSIVTFAAYGLMPNMTYNTSSTTGYANISKVLIGTMEVNGVMPAPNGTVMFTAYLNYTPANNTGSAVKVDLNVSEDGNAVTVMNNLTLSNTSYSYFEVGLPSVSLSYISEYSVVKPVTGYGKHLIDYYLMVGGNVSMTLSDIIPTNATMLYNASYNYNVYLNSKEIYFPAMKSDVLSNMSEGNGTSTSLKTYFTVPDATGLIYLNVTYNNSKMALNSSLVSSSMPASKGVSSGYFMVMNDYAIGYNLLNISKAYYYLILSNANGTKTVNITGNVKSNDVGYDGAFVYNFSKYMSDQYGTYGAVLEVKNYTSMHTYYFIANYSKMAYIMTEKSSYTQGATVKVMASNLVPNEYYSVMWNGVSVAQFKAASNGTGTATFMAPYVTGTQTLYLVSLINNAMIASTTFTITTNVMLMTTPNPMTMSSYAFPTEVVYFEWNVTSHPPVNKTAGVTSAGPVQVTVLLNGTPYTTVTAYNESYILMGSFAMPNAQPGTMYNISLMYTQPYTAMGKAVTSTEYQLNYTAYRTYTSKTSAHIELVSGSGAFAIISSSQVTAIIKTAVGQALKVPLSELNATIKELNGTAVLISTDFGEMLSNISSVNATVSKLSGNVMYINTSLGMISGKINDISTNTSKLLGANVSIQTTLGTISGKITSVSGNTATIKTDLGNLTTSVNSIKSSANKISTVSSTLSTTEIFEIVTLVLVIITLALVAVVIGRTRKQ
ncbi:hypothetical protein [Picrophilus oshimae]|uniref:Hypothetical membrane associated protein n=1 Tax=Picrophilus torridus (strain ATCC 700027 / DSM 9790 / JCM 10055 / NBRC 100828 / KAW 2/3) TaxID=1122961 RepID=Q6L2C5_PICTO|nr:hypothetical protein [Picrophilus oshimae]AAT42877.1 hypothetical membrane associated protein [Picrophilus oshimae DSM 9789]